MTTTETVLVIILVVELSIFFIMCIAVTAVVLQLVRLLKRVAIKAEDVVDSVESAADVLTHASGKLTLFKLLNNVVKLSTNKGKK